MTFRKQNINCASKTTDSEIAINCRIDVQLALSDSIEINVFHATVVSFIRGVLLVGNALHARNVNVVNDTASYKHSQSL